MNQKNRTIRNRFTWLKHRKGSLTFVELVVSFLIVAITSVAVASGIYFAHGTLKRERTKAKAVQILKGEMNYWLGRIHSTYLTPRDIARPVDRMVVIMTDASGYEIMGRLTRLPIDWVDDPETALKPDWYEIKVTLQYDEEPIEPPWIPGVEKKRVNLELVSPMVPSAT